MTDMRMALAELLEKVSDTDLLREMMGFMTQRQMDMDLEGRCGAGHGERNTERENYRTATGTGPGRRQIRRWGTLTG